MKNLLSPLLPAVVSMLCPGCLHFNEDVCSGWSASAPLMSVVVQINRKCVDSAKTLSETQ